MNCWRTGALILSLASSSEARSRSPAQASKVLAEFLAGEIPLNLAVSRVQVLGGESFISAEILFALPRTFDAKTRLKLLECLASLGVGDPDVERVLLKALSSADREEVTVAARGLGRIKCARAVAPLLALLLRPAPGLRRAAASALGEIGNPAASGPLLRAAKAEPELEVRLLMIDAAGRSGDRRQIPAFEGLLKDESESSRLAAAHALCVLGASACGRFAAKLLSSTLEHERLQGVMLFEGSSARLSRLALTPLLADPDHRIRARAARILVEGGDTKSLGFLVIESAKAEGQHRLTYETELERLRISDEQRKAWLEKAGLR